MKRLFMAAILVFTLTSLPTFAAVKAGDKCPKIGKTATLSGAKFKCMKKNKKLVWQKVKLSSPQPAPTPTPATSVTPTPSPTPTPTPTQDEEPMQTATPTPLPTVEKAPTGFGDLIENYRGIPIVVWNEAQILANSGTEKTNFEIEFGPKTKLQTEIGSPLAYLKRASRFWSNYVQPTITKAFFYNYTDLSWVQDKNRNLGGSWHKPEDLANNCKGESDCNSFGGAFKGMGQLFIGVSNELKPLWNLGWVRGNLYHEYTHTVQYTQLNAPANVKLPCWFAEGQPQVIGQTLGFENLIDYKKSRISWIAQPAGLLGDYSPESILRFYELTGAAGNGVCNQNVRPRVYDVGYFTVEALSSIKGIQASMDLVISVGKGNSFESSFSAIYGVTWKEAAPILAQVVSKIYLER
jgi:hypothetical protein